MDREKIINELVEHIESALAVDSDYVDCVRTDLLQYTVAMLKEQKVMSPDEFKNELLKMFSSIWDCEIDHSIFQDTVGELMSAVMQLYTQAVKWE